MKKPTQEELEIFEEIYGEKFNPRSRQHRRWMGKIQKKLRQKKLRQNNKGGSGRGQTYLNNPQLRRWC